MDFLLILGHGNGQGIKVGDPANGVKGVRLKGSDLVGEPDAKLKQEVLALKDIVKTLKVGSDMVLAFCYLGMSPEFGENLAKYNPGINVYTNADLTEITQLLGETLSVGTNYEHGWRLSNKDSNVLINGNIKLNENAKVDRVAMTKPE